MSTSLPSSTLHPLFLGGPTATGKSEIALALAEKIGGEIISVDSMQVYRGLDIGTAKPTAVEQKRVPFHLIDVVDLAESFDAAKFVVLAEKAVVDIQSRGRTPIFCGGTGLYFQAYLGGLGEAPAADPGLRTELEALPFETLLHELRERDPETYEKIDKQNPRRVIRALEVIRLTGKKFSEQRAEWRPKVPDPTPKTIVCLTRGQDDLHGRINARVDEMFRRGLVEETRELLKHGLNQNKTAMQAIGYRQVVEHLRGEHDLAQTVALVKMRTRQFAKRQLTWFRRHGDCRFFTPAPGDVPEKIITEIISAR
ncbi:MAG TPA: tRNA (adenosine(37)-N6)-dimethylallyltransferase MiaA [Verrucomicrobiae bacterium]